MATKCYGCRRRADIPRYTRTGDGQLRPFCESCARWVKTAQTHEQKHYHKAVSLGHRAKILYRRGIAYATRVTYRWKSRGKTIWDDIIAIASATKGDGYDGGDQKIVRAAQRAKKNGN